MWKPWSEKLRSIAENLENCTMSALEEDEKKLIPEGEKVRLKKTEIKMRLRQKPLKLRHVPHKLQENDDNGDQNP